MKTLIIETIDGIQIVKGFGKLQINPVQTQRAQLDKLENSKEIGVLREKVGNINSIKAPNRKDPRDKKRWKSQLEKGKTEYYSAMAAIQKFKEENFDDCIVYMEPKKGEITDYDHASLITLFAKLKSGEKLTIAGDAITDNRGITFWHYGRDSWIATDCTKLGQEIPDGAKMFLNHSDEDRAAILLQREIERIAGLKKKDRDAEKEKALQGAASRAAHQRSVLEVQGTDAASALQAAQSMLATLTAEIEAKYA